MQYDVVIGLEIHVQLNTQSKLFSSAPTAFGASPNSQANEIDLALPGVLPVLNEEAVKKAAIFGFAIGADVANYSVFDRKNYFYPDLPKGYQISQFYYPIVKHGSVNILTESGEEKRIEIERAHLEEDAGKSIHDAFSDQTGIDLNRAGTPLIEIVTAPVMNSAKEAVSYMKKIHSLVRYLGISDANMQEGSFRCDANVSIKPKGSETLGTRTEIKNLNSFRFIEKAINYEVERQMDVLESGGSIIQETRLYDPDKDATRAMRSKEESTDYRYFPDPDLAPVRLSDAFLNEIKASMPELQADRAKRYVDMGLHQEEADLLVETRELADYFEAVLKLCNEPRLLVNSLSAHLLPALKEAEKSIVTCPIAVETYACLIQRIEDGTLSGKSAKTVFEILFAGEADVDAVIKEKGLLQISDTGELEKIVDELIKNNPKQADDFRAGNEKILSFFVGQAMRQTGGKANPKILNDILRNKLS